MSEEFNTVAFQDYLVRELGYLQRQEKTPQVAEAIHLLLRIQAEFDRLRKEME